MPSTLLALGIRIVTALMMPVLLAAAPSLAAAQDLDTAVRVMAIDAETGGLTVIDPDRGDVVGRFTTPTGGYASLNPSSTGRYLLANHYEGRYVTVVDTGLALKPHGDHADLVTAPPFVLATIATGATPAHAWAHDGIIAIHNDGDGTVTILDEAALARGIDPFTFAVAQPDHSSVAVIADVVLVGYYDLGRVDAYGLDGRLLAEHVGACPGAHGEARFANTVAFACADGLLLVTPRGSEFAAQKIAYPGATATPQPGDAAPVVDEDAPRIGALVAHHDNPILVGDFNDGLALITPGESDVAIAVMALPAAPLAFVYDHAGERVVVLTEDGTVHGIDPEAKEILWSTPAITPYAEIQVGEGFAFYPSLAASNRAAYLADPKTGEVVEVDLASGEVTFRFPIGGQPARVALVLAEGVDH